MIVTQNAADKMLDAYLFAQAVAEGNEINWNSILDEKQTENDLISFIVGLGGIAAYLRDIIANNSGCSLEEVDENIIGLLLIAGATQ